VVLEEQPHEVSHLYMSASAWSLSGVFFLELGKQCRVANVTDKRIRDFV